MENKIINGDSYIELPKLIEQGIKVDAVITDPPYNIAKDNNFDTMGRKGIDFGEWDKGFDLIGWIKYLDKLVKPNGSVIIFNDWKNMGDIAKALESNGFIVKDLIRWIKNNPMPRNKERRYITDFEFAIWAVKKGAKWTFNKPSHKSYLTPEFKHPLTAVSEKQYSEHMTQKPIKLMEDIISTHTNIGDLVLDPFSGSGSTLAACKGLERRYIGIELEKKSFDESIEKVNEMNNQIRMVF